MNETQLSIDLRRPEAAVAVIDIKGDVTAACEAELSRVYDEAGDGQAKRIIFNFTGLDYMNSSGIGLLVTLLVRANRSRQTLAAYGLSDHYRQIFELTRLDEAIGMYPDEASAVLGGQR